MCAWKFFSRSQIEDIKRFVRSLQGLFLFLQVSTKSPMITKTRRLFNMGTREDFLVLEIWSLLCCSSKTYINESVFFLQLLAILAESDLYNFCYQIRNPKFWWVLALYISQFLEWIPDIFVCSRLWWHMQRCSCYFHKHYWDYKLLEVM